MRDRRTEKQSEKKERKKRERRWRRKREKERGPGGEKIKSGNYTLNTFHCPIPVHKYQ